MVSKAEPNRDVNVVALLAFVVGLGLAALDLWVVEISASPDSPIIGLSLGLLPSLTAILWVYPTVSWFYARGLTWPSETGTVRSQVAKVVSKLDETQSELKKLQEEIHALRRDQGN
jgi:hypothetical protein